jgi:hypothetical protein
MRFLGGVASGCFKLRHAGRDEPRISTRSPHDLHAFSVGPSYMPFSTALRQRQRRPLGEHRGDRMAFLRNPSFELGTQFWRPLNFAPDVTFTVGPSVNPPPVTGANIAAVVSLVSGGSIAQDVQVDVPSVSCFASVSSVTGSTGSLNIWNLTLGTVVPGVSVSAMPFTATPDWQLVVNTLDIGGPALVRVEFYVTTAGGELSIDNVVLF